MRRKTVYAERPEKARLELGSAAALAVFCENIEEVETADGTQFQADEYTMPIQSLIRVQERFERNKDAWRQIAMQKDYSKAAAEVRTERDRLLAESDASMALDRLGLEVPSGTTFSSWLAFLQSIGKVLNGEAAAYRQALRDIPQQDGFPYDVEWPVKGEIV